MPDPDDATCCQTLPLTTVQQLRMLLHHRANCVGNDALFVTEALLPATRISRQQTSEAFSLLISPRFSALLTSRPLDFQAVVGAEAAGEAVPICGVALSFEAGAIAAFLQNLISQVPAHSTLVETLTAFLPILQPNDPQAQSDFTLQLVQLLAQQASPILPSNSAVRHRAATLEQKVVERTQDLQSAMLAAETASRAKGEFIGAMSHELRTPLTAIIGMSSTLLRWSFGDLNERQRGFIQTIYNSGQHLLGLINDILDLSQLESGSTVLKLSAFSLTLLAQQTLTTMQAMAGQSHVTLELDAGVAPGRDRFIADPYRLQQILLNLLSNAIKFTPEGGHVILRIFADEGSAIFQIKDTGIGIPEEKRSLLFQKFQQLDTSYQRVYQGTGLGLALTKHLVELHGGRITVDSTVDVGTVVMVQLPHRSEARVGFRQQTQRRILLVKNRGESANLLCDILTAAGYQMVWLVEGSTAVGQIEMIQPDAVIVDMEDPGSHGYPLIQQLRQNPMTRSLKVLAVVSPSSGDSLTRSLEAGADDCLMCPIQPSEVLPKVMQLISQNESLHGSEASGSEASEPVPEGLA